MKTITILLLLMFLGLLTGCESSKQNHFLLLVGSQAADYYTTTNVLDRGGIERNPLIAGQPSNEEVLLFKVGVVGVFYGLGELFPEHRKTIYNVGIISGFGAAAWNLSQ